MNSVEQLIREKLAAKLAEEKKNIARTLVTEDKAPNDNIHKTAMNHGYKGSKTEYSDPDYPIQFRYGKPNLRIGTTMYTHPDGHTVKVTDHPRHGTKWEFKHKNGTEASGREHTKLKKTISEGFKTVTSSQPKAKKPIAPKNPTSTAKKAWDNDERMPWPKDYFNASRSKSPIASFAEDEAPKNRRPYLGHDPKTKKYELFRHHEEPTHKSHGEKYSHVVGPFRTAAAAKFMAQHGKNNPHIRSVADAERIVKQNKNK